MIPRALLFTRQQVSDLTGVADDVLAFWIKNGLLVPTSGGQGRGSHRKFDFIQVHVAAILGELRRFGSNIATLKSFAALLQRGCERIRDVGIYSNSLVPAAKLARDLSRFRQGEIVQVLRLYPEPERVPAESEDDLLREHTVGIAPDSPARILEFAETLGSDDVLPLSLLSDLTDGAIALPLPEGTSERCWLAIPSDDGGWDVITGNGHYDLRLAMTNGLVRSGIFLTVSLIIRQIWEGAAL